MEKQSILQLQINYKIVRLSATLFLGWMTDALENCKVLSSYITVIRKKGNVRMKISSKSIFKYPSIISKFSGIRKTAKAQPLKCILCSLWSIYLKILQFRPWLTCDKTRAQELPLKGFIPFLSLIVHVTHTCNNGKCLHLMLQLIPECINDVLPISKHLRKEYISIFHMIVKPISWENLYTLLTGLFFFSSAVFFSGGFVFCLVCLLVCFCFLETTYQLSKALFTSLVRFHRAVIEMHFAGYFCLTLWNSYQKRALGNCLV